MRIHSGIAAAVLSLVLVTGVDAQFIGGFDIDGCWPDSMSFNDLEILGDKCDFFSLEVTGNARFRDQVGIGFQCMGCGDPDSFGVAQLGVEWSSMSMCCPDNYWHVAIGGKLEDQFSVDMPDSAQVAIGVKGLANSNTRNVDTLAGMWGEVLDDLDSGADLFGVYGCVLEDGATGVNYGVYGETMDTNGTNYGVYGVTASTDGWAVYGDGPVGSDEQWYEYLGVGIFEGGLRSIQATGAWYFYANGGGATSMAIGYNPPYHVLHGAEAVVDTAWVFYGVNDSNDSLRVKLSFKEVNACSNTDGSWTDWFVGPAFCDSVAVATNFTLRNRMPVLGVEFRVSHGTHVRIHGMSMEGTYNTVAATIP